MQPRIPDSLRRVKKGLIRAVRFVLVDIPLGVLHLLGIVVSLLIEAAELLQGLLFLVLLILLLGQCPG